MLILVVEDDLGLRECLVDSLRYAGHEVLEAGTYCEAKGLLLHGDPDAVIVDGDFPLNAASPPARFGPVLRMEAEELGIPAVLYTGTEALVQSERAAGRRAYLKPVSVGMLLQAFEATAGAVK